jgi:hypothetical protein
MLVCYSSKQVRYSIVNSLSIKTHVAQTSYYMSATICEPEP